MRVHNGRSLPAYLRLALALAVLGAPTAGARAKPLDAAAAKQIAASWIAATARPSAAPAPGAGTARPFPLQGKSVTDVRALGGASAYVVAVQPRGYVVVAADDELEPVLAFSDTSSFDFRPDPENHLLLMLAQDIPQRLAAYKRLDAEQRTRRAQAWASLRAGAGALSPQGTGPVTDYSVRVPPFIADYWGQSSRDAPRSETPIYNFLYNSHTPMVGPPGESTRALTGCVATSMGMIMHYFRYPASASCSSTITVDGQSQDMSFSDSYNYGSMPRQLSATSSSTEIIQVGKLLRDCGYSVGMDYAVDGSGIPTDKLDRVASAFRNTFGYASAFYKPKSDADWLDRLKDDLNGGYPVQMGIIDTHENAGHSIICDGWGTTGQSVCLHLIIGWGGIDDNWYTVPGFSTGRFTWDKLIGIIYQIRVPAEPPDDPGYPLLASDLRPRDGAGQSSLNVSFSWQGNGSNTGHACDYSVWVRKRGGGGSWFLDWQRATSRSWTAPDYGEYEWMVQSRSGNGSVAATAYEWFKINAPAPPPLSVGDWALTQQTAGILMVRDGANGNDTGARLGDDVLLHILEGPVLAGGRWWYRHDRGGWSAYSGTYQGNFYVYLRKTTPPAQPPLASGDWALTQQTDGILKVRTAPNGADTGIRLNDGLRLQLLEGPSYVGGVWWYRVDQGWVAYASWYAGTYYVYLQKTNPPEQPPLVAGDWALTQQTDGILKVRTTPNGADTGRRLQDGVRLHILEGPVFAGGLWWYRHDLGWTTYASTYQGTAYTYLVKTNPPVEPPLRPGDWAVTQYTDGHLIVRDAPNGNDTGRRLRDWMMLHITEGPAIAGGIWWYRYDYDGGSGWSAYEIGGFVLMVKQNLDRPPLLPGDYAITQNTASILRVRDAPNGNVIGGSTRLYDGIRLHILEGPVFTNGVWWYRHENNVLSGWTAYAQTPDIFMRKEIPPAPGTPSGLGAVTVSAAQVDLRWSDGSSNEVGFKIEQGQNGNFQQIAVVGTDITAYSVVGLSPTTDYSFRVRAYNEGGDSGYSNEASAHTLPLPPAAPGNLCATAAGASGMDLSWQDNSNNEAGFRIERKMGEAAFATAATVPAGTQAWSDSGLTSGTAYTYRVCATNDGGDSPFTDDATASPPVPVSAPEGLAAAPTGATEVDLCWRDSSSSEAGFRIERKADSGAFAPLVALEANAISYTDRGLAPNTTYTYRVRAFADAAVSEFSNEASTTTPADSNADLLVKKAAEPEAAYGLRGVHQETPAAEQIERQSATPGEVVKYCVKLVNDGGATRSFVLKARESAETGWTVVYKFGNANITAPVTSADGYTTPRIPGGGRAIVLVVEMTAGYPVQPYTSKRTTLSLFLDGANTVARDAVQAVATTVLTERPDLSIRCPGDASFGGECVYQQSPRGDQAKSRTTDAGNSVRYTVRVQNRGNVRRSFLLKSAEVGDSRWRLSYLVGSSAADVSAQVRSADGYLTPALAPGTAVTLFVDASPEVAPGGSQRSFTLRAFLDRTDTVVRDALRAATTVTVARRADLLIRCAGEATSQYRTDNVYQTAPTGEQIKTQSVRRNATATYCLQVQNDGNTTRQFTLRAGESAEPGWTVSYRLGDADITAAMGSPGGFRTPAFPGFGRALVVTVRMTPGAGAAAVSSKRATLRVYCEPSDALAQDAVAAVATLGVGLAPSEVEAGPSLAIPRILSPTEGAEVDPVPSFCLRAGGTSDGEVSFLVEISRDGSTWLFETEAVPADAELLCHWPPVWALSTAGWRCRVKAVNASGAESEWCAPVPFTVR